MKLKTKAVSLVFLLAAGAAAFTFFDPTKAARDKGLDPVLFTAAWLPAQRDIANKIKILTNGAESYSGDILNAPWQEPGAAPPGTKLKLIVVQLGHTYMDCSITVRGVVTGPVPALNAADGTAICMVQVTV